MGVLLRMVRRVAVPVRRAAVSLGVASAVGSFLRTLAGGEAAETQSGGWRPLRPDELR